MHTCNFAASFFILTKIVVGLPIGEKIDKVLKSATNEYWIDT